MKGNTGGVVEKAMSIHQSNVAIYNAATWQGDRVGMLADGRRRASTSPAAKRSRPEGIKNMASTAKRPPQAVYREDRPRADHSSQVGHAGAAHHQDHAEYVMSEAGGGTQEGDG